MDIAKTLPWDRACELAPTDFFGGGGGGGGAGIRSHVTPDGGDESPPGSCRGRFLGGMATP